MPAAEVRTKWQIRPSNIEIRVTGNLAERNGNTTEVATSYLDAVSITSTLGFRGDERLRMFINDVVLKSTIMPAHVLLIRTKHIMKEFHWEVFDLPPYGSDLAPRSYSRTVITRADWVRNHLGQTKIRLTL
ncbi:hypothetical protein AVEN_179584-1 [Araneus ventricosus]|uniref:Uncharacterized protein n=1 Tax=Araneus ventricosus TaxID=182803 RepID=A0A4Y2BBX2_ARAVE|nr:hypothetical protein AVEN_179584-1 [Araneus ventricosus]